jgi:hypothetical protein
MGLRILPTPCTCVGVLFKVLFNGSIRGRWVRRKTSLWSDQGSRRWNPIRVCTAGGGLIGWWAITEGKMEGVLAKNALFNGIHVGRK